MATPLLATKLFVPTASSDLILRPSLLSKISEGEKARIILISAPAGFGKSTLISEWARITEQPVAWLSLDENDNNLKSFLSYIIAALQEIDGKIGESILPSLESTDNPPIEAMFSILINEIASSENEFYLFLDDYHEITNQSIHEGIDFFLENVSENAHILICTRVDPPLSLARFRARGQMVEIREKDLRFRPAETSAYMNDQMGLGLSTSDIAAMHLRTEGWVTGLKLAAISMLGRQDKHEFVTDFSGSHHYIIDYLIDEVLDRQDEDTKDFLLQTSILDRFNAPLADFVLGIAKSVSLIQNLDESNLFLISLDDEDNWYRYHHLFADFLKQRMLDQNPLGIVELHSKASQWLEENGLVTEAIDHALAGKDFGRVAKLVEMIGPDMMMKSEFDQLSTWLDTIPRETVRSWPWLCIIQAWMNQRWAKLEEAEQYLQFAEKALDLEDSRPPAGGENVIRGQAAAIRSLNALNTGQIPEAITFANRALDYLPVDHFNRPVASLAIGMAKRTLGEFSEAQDIMVSAWRGSLAVGNHILAQAILMQLGRLQTLQGRLHQASQTFREAIKLTYPKTEIMIPYASESSILLSNILREQNDLSSALEYVDQGLEIGKPAKMVDAVTKGHAAKARILLAQRQLDGAKEESQNIDRMVLDVPDLEPETMTMALDCQIRILLTQNNILEAERLVREKGNRALGESVYFDELEPIILARVWIYSGRANQENKPRLADGQSLLMKMLEATKSVGCNKAVIEILILQSLAFKAQGESNKAMKSLQEAVSLANPEGFVRSFVDEGNAMKELLAETAFPQNDEEYVEGLLSVFAREESLLSEKSTENLIDPLSKREREVLRLLATELSGPEIAGELVVSLNTIRTHTKNIYSKLGVKNRRAAIKKAQQLNLI